MHESFFRTEPISTVRVVRAGSIAFPTSDAEAIATDHPLGPAHRSTDDGFGVHPLFSATVRTGLTGPVSATTASQ
jgi:hypothetical protein